MTIGSGATGERAVAAQDAAQPAAAPKAPRRQTVARADQVQQPEAR